MHAKPMTSIDGRKLAAALPGALGKTLQRVFVADHEDGRFQLFFVFTDGTHYELYGTGTVSGAREVERGDDAEIRRRLALSQATVLEVGQPPAGVVVPPRRK